MRSVLRSATWALAGPALVALWAGCAATPCTGGWPGWEQLPLQHAEYFQLWKNGDARLLLTFGPGGTSDTTGLFVLATANAPAAVPHGAAVLRQPLERVALWSTTHASFITALGSADAIVGCAYTGRLRDSLVAARARAGKVEEIATADGLDRERLMLLSPEALFTYPYGTEAKGPALGAVLPISIAEYLEPHPLGRAEWVRAFGVLLGKEEQAAQLFNGVTERYGAARSSVPQDGGGPYVFFGSAWQGTWSVPAGNSYMAHLIADAGGRYLFADRDAEGNMDVDLETVINKGGKADRWGRVLELDHPATVSDVAGGDARILSLPALRNGGAFYGNSTESDLFGQAGLEPDVVLLDLIGIFRPSLRDGRKPVYFKPVQ